MDHNPTASSVQSILSVTRPALQCSATSNKGEGILHALNKDSVLVLNKKYIV